MLVEEVPLYGSQWLRKILNLVTVIFNWVNILANHSLKLGWEWSHCRTCVGDGKLASHQSHGEDCFHNFTVRMITFQHLWLCLINWYIYHLLFLFLQFLCSIIAPAPTLLYCILLHKRRKQSSCANSYCRKSQVEGHDISMTSCVSIFCFCVLLLTKKKVISSPWVGWYEGNYVLAQSS